MTDILGRRYVWLGPLMLPANFAGHRLRFSAVPVAARTGDPGWPLRQIGTGFLTRFGRRQFCLISRHQLGNPLKDFEVQPQDVIVPLCADMSHLFSGSRITHRQALSDDYDAHDAIALEVPWLTTGLSDAYFFPWSEPPARVQASDEYIFGVGYPSKVRTVSVAEDGSCDAFGHKQYLVQAQSFEEQRNGLSRFIIADGSVLRRDTSGDFDGLSGAPVFSLNATDRRYYFRGLVIRGGNKYMHVLPARWLTSLLQKASEYSAPPLRSINRS